VVSEALPQGLHREQGHATGDHAGQGKTWDDETFNAELAAWNAPFYPAEAEVLRPIIEGDGLLQLMQKNVPAERIQALLTQLDKLRQA